MAHLHGDSAEKFLPEQHKQEAEHPSFLQKIKDKLHVGHKHKEEDVATQATADSADSSKNTTTEPVSATNVKEVPAAARPPTSSVGEEHHHYGGPTTNLSELAGHESEHHGGVPTFMVALPDQDIPEEVAAETALKTSGQTTGALDSEELFRKAQQGEHHHGVPTFLVALPDQDVPDEVTKDTAVGQKELNANSQGKELDSEKLFSRAQQGEHHGGMPTFLVALPDQQIPEVVNEEESSANSRGAGGGLEVDSEKVFKDAHQGEHHHGVPTFLVALPDQDIPDQVSKGVDSTAHQELS